MARTHVLHVDKSKKGNSKTLKDEQTLAQLAENERLSVNDAAAALSIKEREARLIRAGYNSIWMEMRQKYKLPSEFNYEPTTGKVVAKKEK